MNSDSLFSDDDRAYLSMLQSAISRMSTNSLYCKVVSGACISVMLPVFSSLNNQNMTALLAIVVIFMLLDARYLSIERCYVKMFNTYVEKIKAEHIEIRKNLFNLTPDGYHSLSFFFSSFFSWSICVPYLFYVVFIILYMLWLSYVR